MKTKNDRVEVFVDGFNLYFGIAESKFVHSKWLNISALMNSYLKPNQKSVFFPPNRHNNSVAAAAKGSLIIGRKRIIENQFPEEVTKADGYVLNKPAEW